MTHQSHPEKKHYSSAATLYYCVRSPWSWVLENISHCHQTDIVQSRVGYQKMVDTTSQHNLPSRQLLILRNKRDSSLKKQSRGLPEPCTLRLEIMEDNGLFEDLLKLNDNHPCDDYERYLSKLCLYHGISKALNGCNDKDELVMTLSKYDISSVCPKSILLEWDISKEKFDELLTLNFPFLLEQNNNIHNVDEEEKKYKQNDSLQFAVLKAPLGSRGEGVYFVSNSDEIYDIILQNKFRAINEPGNFLESLQKRKGRIPAWVLQTEIHLPMVIRGGRKFHLRSYVVVIEKMFPKKIIDESNNMTDDDDNKLFDVYVYNQHEVRIAANKIDTSFTSHSSTSRRDRSAHITNGACGDSTERCLLHEVDELMSINMNDKLILFMAQVFGDKLIPDVSKRVEESVNMSDGTTDSIFLPQSTRFAIAGVDIMVDQDGNLFILEVNVNPAAPPEETVLNTPFHAHLVQLMSNLICLVTMSEKQRTSCGLVGTIEQEKRNQEGIFFLASEVLLGKR